MRCSRLILLFLLLAIPATCFSWPAKVVSVADGDTITVFHQGQRKEIRLSSQSDRGLATKVLTW